MLMGLNVSFYDGSVVHGHFMEAHLNRGEE